MQKSIEHEFWGDALVPWPADVVAAMQLSEADSAYLIQVGLPAGFESHITIQTPLPQSTPTMRGGRAVIAFDAETAPIWAVPQEGGRIFVGDPVEDDVRFVNSNVRTFGAFLMLFKEYQARVVECDFIDEAAALALIDEIEQKMVAADPPAMEAETYWSCIVEQMRHGMM